ncbi:MAG: ABC transporter ATP-binding protein [Chloroflexota bacterium]
MNPFANLLLTYLKPRWQQTTLLFLLLLLVIGLQLYSPLILSNFIDAAVEGQPLSTLMRIAVLFLGVALVTQLVSVIETYVAENLGMMATNQLRVDIARHCLRLDLSFHNSHTPGELIERVDGDVTALSNFFSRFVVRLIGNVLLVIGVLIYLASIDIWLAGMLTVLTIAGLMLIVRIRDIAIPSWKAARVAIADMFGFLNERLNGVEDLHTSGATDFSVGQLQEHGLTLLHKERKATTMTFITIGSSRLFFTIVTAVTLLFIVNLYTSALITLGTAYLIYRYTEMLMRPVEEINRQMQDFQRAVASVMRVQELLDTKSRIADEGQQHLVTQTQEGKNQGVAVEFRDVSFAYPTGDTVLHDISFHLKPGQVLGLLGHTGSGKTTLTRLLFRLYDPTAGEIMLDDTPLDAFALTDLRRQIGLVTQDVQLFDATVRDNLTFFDDAISDQEILDCLTDVGLDSWATALPLGLDTRLGQQSEYLSAGEAQLLALVRVFLADPALVLLDEASSRLDPITERHIEDALNRLLMNRTAIIIAHRLSTVERADTIMILDKGQVIEYGERTDLAISPTSKFAYLLQVGLDALEEDVIV